MLNLLIKDFKLMFVGESGRAKRIVYFLTTAIFIACFVGIEVFLYSEILNRIKNYSGAPVTFTCLFLSVISILMIFNGISKAQKLFFDKKDTEQLSTHPVSDGMLIGSKLIFLLINHYLTSFVFVYPIFVSYGVTFGKGIWFFYLAVFYPLLSFLFEVGVALIFVYPVWIVSQFLRRHVVLEFIVSVVILFALAFVYSKVLNEFVNMVSGNSVSLIFTQEFMSTLGEIVDYIIPINFLTFSFVAGLTSQLLPYICISLGIFILGTIIAVVMFNYVRNVAQREGKSAKVFRNKPRSVTMGLAMKEIALITKNPEYIFSFSGLLVVQPFLMYLIVIAMLAIFNSGTFLYYTALFPNFASFVCIFMVIMITLIINSGANQYITMEFATIKNLKIIPVDYRKQLLIKVAIPFIMSEASLIVSVAVLWVGQVMSTATCLFALILSTVSLLVFDIISMCEELNIRHGKPRSTFLSTLYAYLLPFVFMITGLVLSYLGVSLALICVAAILLFLLMGAPIAIRLWRKMGEWFMLLETLY